MAQTITELQIVEYLLNNEDEEAKRLVETLLPGERGELACLAHQLLCLATDKEVIVSWPT